MPESFQPRRKATLAAKHLQAAANPLTSIVLGPAALLPSFSPLFFNQCASCDRSKDLKAKGRRCSPWQQQGMRQPVPPMQAAQRGCRNSFKNHIARFEQCHLFQPFILSSSIFLFNREERAPRPGGPTQPQIRRLRMFGCSSPGCLLQIPDAQGQPPCN